MKKTTTLWAIVLFTITARAQNVTFEWAKQLGGTDTDVGNSVTVDAWGNVYTTGYFNGTVDFDPGIGATDTFNLISAGYQDIFISKLNSSGDFVWAKRIGGTKIEYGNSITVDGKGNVYVTGLFGGSVDFDPGTGTDILVASGLDDVFIVKLDSSGNLRCARQLSGQAREVGYSIAVDSSYNIYITGSFEGTVDFDPDIGDSCCLTSGGWRDIFISKLDSSGNYVWVKQIGGILFDSGNSIKIDASGNIYLTGGFEGTVDFDPDTGIFYLSGYSCPFILKLDKFGNFSWAKQLNTKGGASSLVVDGSGNVYTTGYFEGIADFDPDTAIFKLTSIGWADVFISKLDSSGKFVWAKQIGGNKDALATSIDLDAFGNVYITGWFVDTADFDPGINVFNLISGGGEEIFIACLTSTGNFVWAKQLSGHGGSRSSSITVDDFGNIYTTGYFSATVDFDPGTADTFNLTAASWDIFVHKMSQQGVGILENNSDKNIKAYPNPTTGQLQIDLGKSYNYITVTVRNIMAQIISMSQFTSANKIFLNIEQSSGVYFVEIHADDEPVAYIKVLKN